MKRFVQKEYGTLKTVDCIPMRPAAQQRRMSSRKKEKQFFSLLAKNIPYAVIFPVADLDFRRKYVWWSLKERTKNSSVICNCLCLTTMGHLSGGIQGGQWRGFG